jgi:hypothetical protein
MLKHDKNSAGFPDECLPGQNIWLESFARAGPDIRLPTHFHYTIENMRKYYVGVTSFLTPTSFQWHEFPTWIVVRSDRKEIFIALLDTGSKPFCE